MSTFLAFMRIPVLRGVKNYSTPEFKSIRGKIMKKIFNILLMLSVSCWAQAGGVSVPHNFSPNTPAKASEVNANFAALVAKINQLENRIADLEGNSVIALDGVLKLGTYDADEQYPTAIFEGVNLQVVSGLGTTHGANGAGNIIIGYNEDVASSPFFCSNPTMDNQTDCENNGSIWDNNVHRGSHYLVLGKGNSFDNYSGIVSGNNNVINGLYSSILGGDKNLVSNYNTVVVGGSLNVASGLNSVVSGGIENTASGDMASVTAGEENVASGAISSVTGGADNEASGIGSTVSGGVLNVSSGSGATVSGGQARSATGDFDWTAGSLTEDN